MQTNQPLVSVIIACYNGERFLATAINSVLGQTWGNLECLVVDDGSTDGSREVVEGFVERDKRVRLISKEHSGVSATRNVGIKHARGDWVQFLDVDDWLHSNKIKFQMGFRDAGGQDDELVFYSDLEVVRTDPQDVVTDRRTFVFGELDNEELRKRILSWQFRAGCPLCSVNTLYQKSVFERKQFSTEFQACVDIDLHFELLCSNITFVYTPIIGVSVRAHESNMSRNKERLFDAWIQFLEGVRRRDSEMLKECSSISYLTRKAIVNNERETFDRLLQLIQASGTPVYFSAKRIAISNPAVLRLIFFMGRMRSLFIRALAPVTRKPQRLQ